MELNTILLSLLTALIGAFIGTFVGTCLINRKSENKIKEIRKIAIKGLNIIKKYSSTKGTYCNAKDDFNNTLTIAEKRTVLVSLHKIGVPIEMPIGNTFDIKNINFLSKFIDKDEIEGMIIQINNGHCDDMFFLDADKYFTENTKIKTIRNIGVKLITEVLNKSIYNSKSNMLTYPENWIDKFSYGEHQIIGVFWSLLKNPIFFDKQTGNPKEEKINELIKDVEIGLWDVYLQWDYDAYQSVLAQTKMANFTENVFNHSQQQYYLQTQQNNSQTQKNDNE